MNQLKDFFDFVGMLVAIFIYLVVSEPIHALMLLMLLLTPVGFGFLIAKAF